MLHTQRFSHCQDTLSEFQAVPVIGPAFVSPAKLLVSKFEVITGLVVSIFNMVAAIFGTKEAGKNFKAGICCVLEGIAHALYAVVNMLSLGILGLIVELVRSHKKETPGPQ